MIDLLVTIAFSIFWLLFAWQHGFANSPDSWYRGVLGKSIVEGHPYFTNIKQGWLYEYGPWHHDAAHSPLLPVIYALFFLIFGNKIFVANIVVSLSAGLLIFPLLRLSRSMLRTPFAGFIIYLLIAFNERNDFLFEVFAGLSIPTTVMLLFSFLFFQWRISESEKKGYLWGGILSLTAFYYIRPGEQVVFVWLLFWSLLLGRKLLDPAVYKRMVKMWLWAAGLALPWLLRNLILFKHPFFSHTTAALWTDRGYDYWTYHERIPLPTATAYFKTHSLFDFIVKLFIQGPGNYLNLFGQTLYGPLWLYLLAFAVSMGVIFYKVKDGRQRFLFITILNVFIAYSVVYSLVPVLDKRYMMLPFSVIAFTVIAALFYLFGRMIGPRRDVFYMILILLVLFIQRDFLLRKQFAFSFSSSDRSLQEDPVIKGLKQKLSPRDVILGPFADVQRLNFATGLTLIEEPDNLRMLDDPAAFFRKYSIRYSMVDVSDLLPKEMIEEMEMVGNKLLIKIKLSPLEGPNKPVPEKINRGEPGMKYSIRKGIRNRMVFIDGYHGAQLEKPEVLRSNGMVLFTSTSNLEEGQEQLFRSGILLINYRIGGKELSEKEKDVIGRFIANGGRVFLLCPAWVWYSYDKKGIEDSPYYQIAKKYGLVLTGDSVSPPLVINDQQFSARGIEKDLGGTFSKIIYEAGEPLLAGSDKKAAAVFAQKGGSKIILWGHNNILSAGFLKKQENQDYLLHLFDRLWK
jgi:hypothetical protein